MNGDIKASNSKCQKAQGDHHGQKKCRFYLLLCVAKVKFCQVYFKYLNFTKCTPSNLSRYTKVRFQSENEKKSSGSKVLPDLDY